MQQTSVVCYLICSPGAESWWWSSPGAVGKKPSQPPGAAFLLQIPSREAWRWHLRMSIAPLEPGRCVQWGFWLVVLTTTLVP